MKILITYFSLTGNTEKMARIIAETINQNPNFEILVKIKPCQETTKDDMLEADAIIVGTPTYYGLPAKQIIELVTERVRPHGQLEGKIGAAFSSSHNIGGGNETALMAILQAMLVHGMIIQGIAKGDHYGPVSIDSPDERATNFCKDLAIKVCELVNKIKK